MPLVMKEGVSADPGDVGLLGATAVVSRADGLADAIEESWFRRTGRSRFVDGERRADATVRQRVIGDLPTKRGRAHAPGPWASTIADRIGGGKRIPQG